jgi:hypothetical protein
MKKLLMTLGIVLGFTAVVSAQSPEVKPSEALASKPDTKERPAKDVQVSKPVAATVKVVTPEKTVNKTTPQKVAIVETPVSNKSKSSTPADTDVQFKENKTKGKN